MKKPRLIPNWRKAGRMLSVQAMGVAGAVQAAWLILPADMKATIPPAWVQWLTVALLVMGVFGRLVDQPEVKP